MRNNLILSFIFFVFLSLPEGKAQVVESREIGNFTSLFVMGEIRVELIPSTKNSLTIEIKEASARDIITELDKEELIIRLKTDIPKEAKIKISLYFKDLEKIVAASKAYFVSPDTLKAQSMSFEAKSGAKMEFNLMMDSIIAEAKQGGLLVFYGNADKQDVGVSSGGTYSAFELIASESIIRASTGGRAKVTTTERLNASAHTAAYIAYKGNPAREKLKTNLGGEVVKMQE